jgi:hypothetical protein
MILIEKTRELARMSEPAPYGPGFEKSLAQRAAVMEVMGSTLFDDVEECRFILRDASGQIIGERQISGY